ncbi:MAG: 4-(cytidine 5'-diphospho)-2-C-methyl-D-erythritol kinase, partial [Actinomycetota bacterium]
MSVWEAPAKVNLSLEVRPPDQTGKHPLRSLVQTVEWSDVLTLEEGDEDRLTVEGAAELADDGENLVWRAVSALRRATGRPRPLLDILLKKEVPVAAGLGGGSSDAAAALVALAEMTSTAGSVVTDLAPGLGSDVLLFLEGGLMWMEGYGERLTATQVDPRYALAIAVPNLELSTALVY